MRESYCGLCDDCQLGHPGFLETVSRLKDYLEQVRANVWLHCFPGQEGFSLPEFRKGLEWFLAHTECPGCRNGRGLDDCPIRVCAQARGLNHCYQVPGPGTLRQVRTAPGAVSRREGQPAPPPVEVQGEGISPEAGRGEEVGGKARAKREKRRKSEIDSSRKVFVCVYAP